MADGGTATMQVQVPPGAVPGTTIQVQAPSGQMIQVQVPPGLAAGQVFQVQIPGAAAAAGGEDEYEAYVPLPDKRFDVTDPFESICLLIHCPCLGYQTKTLILTDQEVFFRVKNLCGTKKQRRPYAQLGSVDKHSVACGCHSLVTDFAPLNEKGEGGIKVGCCGMDEQAVDAIVRELQDRKHKRGGIAQIRKLDYVIGKMVKIGTQVPVLLNKMGVQYDKKAAPRDDKIVLQEKRIDVSNNIEKCCGCTTKTLLLGPEEATLEVNVCGGCNTIRSKREYGELGFVEKRKNCVCCFRVSSDISPIPGQSDMAPGCDCTNRAKVAAVVRELRDRMAVRGQVGQIRKQEKILGMVGDVEDNLKKAMDKAGIAFPPSQAEMQKRFGENPLGNMELGKPRIPPEQVEKKTWDVTSTLDSWLTCCCTCGMAGCTTETLELEEDVMYIKTKNNLDDSDVKVPYAEMDSVDFLKACCCCFSVNDQSPGFGCDKEKVMAITADLQERKVKRGNIAHLKQLRSMQATAVGTDVMADMLLNKEGMQFPPSPQVMDQVWKDKKPRILTHPQTPHIEPEKDFQEKTYDVTNYWEMICGFLCCPCQGCTKTHIELGPDEMLLVKEDFCQVTQSRTPYGNLGSVETETSCCCCSELPDVATPGCGCSNEYVEEIAAELQARKVQRGNIAQMKQQENIIIEVLGLEAKMDMLANKKGMQYPPAPEVMAQCFLPA